MAKVLILSAWPGAELDVWKHSSAFLLKHSAELDALRQHSLTEDPTEADIILFAEMGGCGAFSEVVRSHPYYRRYWYKCFLFYSADSPFVTVPGIYASLARDRYRPDFTRTGFYLYLIENAFITPRPCSGEEKYLASFVGSVNTHPVRARLFNINRDDIYVKDTSGYSSRITYFGDPAERAAFWSEYAESLASAKFSLCPRGQGTGSIRLFESMKMGRACVILSDAWQPNDKIDWDSFSIRVPEADAEHIPQILERHEDRAAEMGVLARRAWEEHFSEKVRFHRVVELCLDIQKQGKIGKTGRTMMLLSQLASPKNLRRYLSSKKDLYRNTGKIYW